MKGGGWLQTRIPFLAFILLFTFLFLIDFIELLLDVDRETNTIENTVHISSFVLFSFLFLALTPFNLTLSVLK